MTTLTELLIAEHAFAPAAPGFVGAALDLHGPPAEHRRLRHGFVSGTTVSVPPSPGLEVCVSRLSDDLARTGRSPAGVRIALEAGLDGGGPLGLPRRWVLAHTLAPVLAAAFADSPGDGWRSVRQSRHRDRPVLPPATDPRRAWAAAVLDTGGLRERLGHRPGLGELDRHIAALRLPVAARGHLEIDVADSRPGDDWRVAVAVTTVLLDDPRAATAAETATAHLAGETGLWERAARDALTDPVLAVAARDCFLAAYAALARQGVARDLRDAVAAFTERYVLRGRCPADDTSQARSPVM